MKIIYNLIIYLYAGIVHFFSLFDKKAKLKTRGIRKSILDARDAIQKSDGERIFIHCASQGEHEQALPIIRWVLQNTDYDIVLSFFSPSGFRNADYDEQSRVHKIYLPFDTSSSMSNLISTIQPKCAIIIKNEWWWNLLYALKKMSVKSFLVSATIRPSHYFIKYPIEFFTQGLETFSSIFVVDEESKQHISKVYNGNVFLSRDTRIDQVKFIKNENLHESTLHSFKSDNVIIYGSVWESDIESIDELIRIYPKATHLIYPHELDDENIFLFKSKLKGGKVVKSTNEYTKGVNIISAMGELKYAYQLANLAYIGGGFGAGIHNILEAAVYNIPTLFGPHFVKSNEARHLVGEQCAFTFSHPNMLDDICAKLDKDSIRKEIETKLKAYFSPNFSPTEIICQEIFQKKE